jgi:hypothetical protein
MVRGPRGKECLAIVVRWFEAVGIVVGACRRWGAREVRETVCRAKSDCRGEGELTGHIDGRSEVSRHDKE